MPRILFVKTSSLGDVVHNYPAVSDVARCVPGAEIDWLVEESFAEIASLHAAVRRVVPVALRRWRRGLWSPSVWSEMRALRKALRAEPYEAVIDTQGLIKSALLGALAYSDTATPTESVTLKLGVRVSAADTTTPTETITLALNARVSASDTATPSEAVTLKLNAARER